MRWPLGFSFTSKFALGRASAFIIKPHLRYLAWFWLFALFFQIEG